MANKVQLRCISLMNKTARSIENILQQVTQEEATTYRDPGDGVAGWTTLEVLGHLLDYEEVVRERAELMIHEFKPRFAVWEHERIVRERRHNEKSLKSVLQAFTESRKALQTYFTALSAAEWERQGIHPEYGDYSMTDLVLQVGWHDANHIEQMTRILNQRGTG